MARRVRQEVLGVCVVLGSIYAALSLFSYWSWDHSLFTYSEGPVRNYGGVVGSYLSDILMTSIGVASYALPLFGLIYGIKRLLGKERQRVHLIGAVLFFVSAPVFAGLMVSSFGLKYGAGGLLGKSLGWLFVKGLSTVGAYIVALAMVLSSLIMLSPVSLINLVIKPGTEKKKPKRKKKPPEEEPPAMEEEYIEPIVVEPSYLEEADVQQAGEAPVPTGTSTKGYKLPQLELLNLYEPVERLSKEELISSSMLLEQKLQEFSVEGKVVQVHTGPVVTMYEFEPAPGVKISRVAALADDLALSLKARSVRIAPLPGKAALGVEIPNQNRETVSLRDILSAETFKRSSSKLTVALGKDIFGTPVAADLSRMPHLLVAGSTGAGKSVFLNAMVMSILYKAKPDEVKMLMIDPKLLELTSYDGIPHLISPVVTNPKEAAEMLRSEGWSMRWSAATGLSHRRELGTSRASTPPPLRRNCLT
jgi:S-DNA-T family DNA segregation ATPase FtsK/SpoIIIE